MTTCNSTFVTNAEVYAGGPVPNAEAPEKAKFKSQRTLMKELAAELRAYNGIERSQFVAFIRRAIGLGIRQQRIAEMFEISAPALCQFLTRGDVENKNKPRGLFVANRMMRADRLAARLEHLAKQLPDELPMEKGV